MATKCVLVPTQAGYAMQNGQETVSVQLDGGASRSRRDIIGATSRVQAQWITDAAGWKYLQAHYRTISQSGSLPFLVDLILHEGEVEEFTAKWVGTGPALQTYEYPYFWVFAELEVTPIDADETEDIDYVAAYNELGSPPWTMLDELDTLVNVTLPGDLPAPGDTGSLPE